MKFSQKFTYELNAFIYYLCIESLNHTLYCYLAEKLIKI